MGQPHPETMTHRILYPLLFLLLALPASAQDELPLFQLPMAGDPAEDAVQARLIAGGQAVVPGQTLRLGVHLAQDEGWHTYWRNGGDSGLPTYIEWDLPEGVEAGPILWPTPKLYEEAGGLLAYGYADDIVLFTDVRLPEDLRVGDTVTFRADVDWLMCKELCIPGAAEVELTLPVASAPVPTTGRDAELMAASWARVPTPTDDFVFHRELTAVPAGQTVHLALQAVGVPPDTEWTWFPFADDVLYPDDAFAVEHDGDLLLGLPVEVDASAEPGDLQWGGVLELAEASGPRYLEVTTTIPVAGPGVTIERASPDVFASLLGEVGAVATPEAARSIFYYLLLAFVGGIILNVMPCVLPVISLKILGFVQHANDDRATVFRLGLMFAAGVLASFLALALVVIGIQAAGDQLGWGFQFQNPTFVVVMGAIVFAFGLSLFGVYEIILPFAMAGGSSSRGAYAESFFNGILATALATPCTAPFMGTALGFAFTQPAGGILAIFLAIGLGLAVPYVLLSANPAWLRFVPKPGMWMERFKQGMGFLLMATLIWLLWVLGQQVGTDGVVWALAFLLTLGFALWLYGAMLTLNSGTGRRVLVWAIMIAMVVGGWRVFLSDSLSYEPGTAAQASNHDGWETFDPVVLEETVRAGNTVFVDFTAAWCWTCKVNEKTVLATDAVQDKFRELGVVKMMGDWTRRDPVITEVLRQYGRSGVPFYIVFPAGRMDDPIPLPEVITEGIVIDALEKAGPSQTVTRQASL